MSFNIASLLKADQTNDSLEENAAEADAPAETPPLVATGAFQQAPVHLLVEQRFDQSSSSSSSNQQHKSPTLTELQMLLGIGGTFQNAIGMSFALLRKTCVILARKHQYKRVRKAAAERKPRQAYSSKQLERLETEFKVIIPFI